MGHDAVASGPAKEESPRMGAALRIVGFGAGLPESMHDEGLGRQARYEIGSVWVRSGFEKKSSGPKPSGSSRARSARRTVRWRPERQNESKEHGPPTASAGIETVMISGSRDGKRGGDPLTR